MIIGVSPEPSGYGSPQQFQLINSISNKFLMENLFIVPNAPFGRTILTPNVKNFVGTYHPWSFRGSVERAKFASQFVTPDVEILLLVNPASLAVIPFLKGQPFIVYLGLEPYIDHDIDFQQLFLKYSQFVDVFIYPNYPRAKFEAETANIPGRKIHIVRNANCLNSHQPLPLEDRFIDFIYSGNLNGQIVDLEGLSKVGLAGSTRVYGALGGENVEISNIEYEGLITNLEVLDKTRRAKYGLTLWKPNSFGRINAAPNKVYNSLAQGTPLLSYPYPEVVEIISKYGCGIVSTEFTSESLRLASKTAMAQVKDGKWKEMSKVAFEAHRMEYNWEYQILPVLETLGDRA